MVRSSSWRVLVLGEFLENSKLENDLEQLCDVRRELLEGGLGEGLSHLFKEEVNHV